MISVIGSEVISARWKSSANAFDSALSALASTQPFAGAFGQGTSDFAQLPGPHGQNIHALQAGVVPDEVVPNTCNE